MLFLQSQMQTKSNLRDMLLNDRYSSMLLSLTLISLKNVSCEDGTSWVDWFLMLKLYTSISKSVNACRCCLERFDEFGT